MENDGYDWLNIKIRVVHPKGDWEMIDPFLLTDEIQDMIDWFKNILEEKPINPVLKTLENGLKFHMSDDNAGEPSIRVYFGGYATPDWGIKQDLYLDFKLAELDLESICSSLISQLAMFPIRPKNK
jgi:hypothetical protein